MARRSRSRPTTANPTVHTRISQGTSPPFWRRRHLGQHATTPLQTLLGRQRERVPDNLPVSEPVVAGPPLDQRYPWPTGVGQILGKANYRVPPHCARRPDGNLPPH